jgi:hypothetical protein
MSKTPEELASEWYWGNLTYESPIAMLTNPPKYPGDPKAAFLAGYEAGSKDMQTQLAVGKEVISNLLTPTKWISVKERLPEYTPMVLANCVDGYELAYYGNYGNKWTNTLGTETLNVTHWMPLPKPPKEEK